jgi:hypothetical protein
MMARFSSWLPFWLLSFLNNGTYSCFGVVGSRGNVLFVWNC